MALENKCYTFEHPVSLEMKKSLIDDVRTKPTFGKTNRMKEIFNKRKTVSDNVNTIKSKDVSGKMFSIDNLALKLAHDKVNYLSDVTSGSEDGCDVSNINCDNVVEDEGRDLIGCEEGNGLSRIIREIYERSLKRDKLVDDKIKTLADIVTKSFQENNHEGALHDSEAQAENNGDDTDETQTANMLPFGVDSNKTNGTESVDLASSSKTIFAEKESYDYLLEVKTEPIAPDLHEACTEMSVLPPTANVSTTIRVPERPDIIEEKYEYFSRNVELFLTRDAPKMKSKVTRCISSPENYTTTRVQQESDMAATDLTDSDRSSRNNLTKMGNEKPFACDICNRTFSQNGHLNRHMRIHTGDKPFQCDVCGKEFSQSGDKRRHERTHTSFRPYQCFICDKEFNQSGHLQRHLRVHAGHILYNNGEFDKELTRKKYTEEKEAAKDKTKKCPLCDKIFIKKYLLERHIRSHTGETPYKCGECGKGFTRKDRLQTHARIHTGEKPYCCNQCGKGFNQSSHLKTHIRIHTGDKPYKCGICGRGFAQSHDRKKHVRVHTGERPYICPLCGKDFNDNSQLWRHARTHDDFDKSEGTSFKCRVCDNEYEYSSQLLQHMKEHTNEGVEQLSVPNLVGFENDVEMEEVRLTAEALVKDTIAATGNDVDMCQMAEFDRDVVELNENNDSSSAEIIKNLNEETTANSEKEHESSESKWDGDMYIAENVSSDSN